MAFRKDNKLKTNFSKIRVSLASPEQILENSYGEVTKHETVSYRTLKPERDGLYCERIFGPVKDYECHCGKYKGNKYRGITCDRCGVEVTQKMVRRERMGHIALKVPVVHVWYSRSIPNKIAYLLGFSSKELESIIYYDRYVVIQPGVFAVPEGEASESHPVNSQECPKYLEAKQLLKNEHYEQFCDRIYEEFPGNDSLENSDPNKFIAKSGAEAIYDLLANIDLDALADDLRNIAQTATSQQKKAEALKRLPVVEAFRASAGINRPEWMVLKVIPVIPPDLRPLMPLDGGRFATSDLNDLYIRVITRNNRLGRMIEANAPEVIMRNEKRMLQEAVDALFDNSRKTSALKSDQGRALKSLSDSLKGKQGRFRQNLLGKRVDYSARSVIVVGPELKMNECGLPKDMAAELYKPFVMRKLIERGIVKTEKSAKKIVDRRDPVIWEIVENVIKGHPVLLNRAPTLHRLGIQAFQPKLIEGKAIQLPPLSCAAFNADFDGDQMAVHLPLGNEAIAEAQLLMLASHNILNPASGEPITVPSQDMVLGLYYISKFRSLTPQEQELEQQVIDKKRIPSIFYSAQEAYIAYDNGRIDIHKPIKVMVPNARIVDGEPQRDVVETSVGRLMFNDLVPNEVGYINELLGKKSLKRIIKDVLKVCGVARTAQFLDDIKNLGYRMAFLGGLSFNLQDVLIPAEKKRIITEATAEADSIIEQNRMGEIDNQTRYNKVVAIWNEATDLLSNLVMEGFKKDNDGFNSIYMMLDSGARGSKEQIRQLAGLRGLMAKPQKSGSEGGAVIENPITSNFLEGLSVQEYFISTHGARKGLADTALKTADAGYLTRRLVDVSHDVIINEEDCGTLRGIEVSAVVDESDNEVASLESRIIGRTSVQDIYNTNDYTDPNRKLIVAAGEEIREQEAEKIKAANIKSVEIRSVLTCDSRYGVCAKCYGRNLATHRPVQIGEVVGVIAAQSIGEPGTQLTLRTFHAGGVAGSENTNRSIVVKEEEAIVELSSDLRAIVIPGQDYRVIASRESEIFLYHPESHNLLKTYDLQYGSKLHCKTGDKVVKGQTLAEWDPFNSVVVAETAGTLEYVNLEEGVNYKDTVDATSGYHDVMVIESKEKSKLPELKIIDPTTGTEKLYSLPAGCRLTFNPKTKGKMQVNPGDELYKIPRVLASAGDITGGLPRVTELFEARNPSNPAILSEIDGVVEIGKIKRNNREVSVTSRLGEVRKYLIPTAKHILVQNGDVVRAGTPLSDGAVTPSDILAIKGPTALQEYIVNEIQGVYRKQNVGINDKHFEVIVRQMMRKVEIMEPGDSLFLEKQMVDKQDVQEENDRLWGMNVVEDAGDSEKYRAGALIPASAVRDENSSLQRRDLTPMKVREAVPATSRQVLQGITRAALQTKSFMSAASFQETTKVLNEAAINAKVDDLLGLKENVICGHLIPAGTGLRAFNGMVVMRREDYERAKAAREETGHDPEFVEEVAAEAATETAE